VTLRIAGARRLLPALIVVFALVALAPRTSTGPAEGWDVFVLGDSFGGRAPVHTVTLQLVPKIDAPQSFTVYLTGDWTLLRASQGCVENADGVTCDVSDTLRKHVISLTVAGDDVSYHLEKPGAVVP